MNKILRLLEIVLFILEFGHSNGQYEKYTFLTNTIKQKREAQILDKTDKLRNINAESMDNKNYHISRLTDVNEHDMPRNSKQLLQIDRIQKSGYTVIGGINANLGRSGNNRVANAPNAEPNYSVIDKSDKTEDGGTDGGEIDNAANETDGEE